MTRTWQTMKEITGKSKVNSNRFPKSIMQARNQEVFRAGTFSWN